jgi:hypothetical protein
MTKQQCNIRWKSKGKWNTNDGVELHMQPADGHVLILQDSGGVNIAMRVNEVIHTKPVTLICALCLNPMEDTVE